MIASPHHATPLGTVRDLGCLVLVRKTRIVTTTTVWETAATATMGTAETRAARATEHHKPATPWCGSQQRSFAIDRNESICDESTPLNMEFNYGLCIWHFGTALVILGVVIILFGDMKVEKNGGVVTRKFSMLPLNAKFLKWGAGILCVWFGAALLFGGGHL
jgi:hypothetical protein